MVFFHIRLGSTPVSYARVLPCTTPSTFTMGTILKMKLSNTVAHSGAGLEYSDTR